MGYNEKKGYWPLMGPTNKQSRGSESSSSNGEKDAEVGFDKKTGENNGEIVTKVRSVSS